MIAPGVQTFSVPMPGPLATVNVHLVELDDGYLLVDTGWGSSESLQALEDGLAGHGVSWAAIRTILITHLHPDHVGNAREAKERSGARLLMHHIDAQNLAALASFGRSPFFSEAWRVAGVPSETREKIDQRIRANRRSFPPAEPDWALEGGERINVRGGTLEVVWTPGHSAGHVCLYSPEHRYLIAGDHMLEEITPNVGWRPGEDMLAKFRDSLAKVEQLDVEVIIPSHGAPFSGHRTRVQAMLEHHEERCQKILGYIGGEASTAHEIVQKIWPRRLGLIDYNLAILEILAHLEYLRRRGPVSAEPLESGALAWRQGG